MSNIPLEELARIGREIESTPPDEHGNISNAEFAWLYTPRKPLRPLKKQKGEIAGLFMLGGSGFVLEDYSAGSAIGHVHNHPSGNMQPTFEDLNVLLGGVARGENLTFSLIASTHLGIVTGFYELEYKGERANVAALIKSNKGIYGAHLDRKYDLLDRNPEMRANMKVGDDVLSPHEYNTMISETMNHSSIISIARPLNGYGFKNWRFMPK